ncbi:ABC transporter substrate-binding protein [Chelatococcus sp. SYSU_G07232]|uniref:ABC transporter substrate-binding protein n=1 Tax=Chelatococcus albus TaxID=3047466 RepID=A0ABT7AHS7_9HYPH|nr:ABC transporter substrate-binding protein [Chelatococcus sp. SYSU_G07232]MDJ1158940.1 ABC transporter substrate-binding protein [Chelatococcus sp. SYSU_G07232]
MSRSIRRLIATAAVGLALVASTAEAKTFRFAFQGDYKSLDPYSLNETFTLGMHAAVYEGLTKRGPNLEILPGLAEKWEVSEDGLRWRFTLRKGVKFHNGEDFTADDVIFSAERVRADGSDLKTRVPADAKFVKVDDHTVDVVLTSPNPTLNAEWHNWYIMSKKWAEANNSAKPTSASASTPSHASLNENGTGPFIIESHQPGVKTVWKPNPNWWEKPKHNLTEVIFTPIASDATRVAALLSGEVDWIDPVPLQDVDRVNASANAQVLQGPELRTIFLGFDQYRDELKYSSVKGKNPFKDVRVRKAFYQAIDIEAIKTKVMRGASVPSALMISPLLFDRAGEFKRFPYDPEGAKKLLAEAGYANGFEVGMDCPNDRYVNDERICQAVVGMLARVGVKVNLNAQPKAKYFAKVLASGGYDTSLYLLGWTPSSFDSLSILVNLYGCRDEKGNGGNNNLGNYCNPKVEELTKQVRMETDKKKRDALIAQVYDIVQNQEAGYIPLHQQALAWGVSKKVKLVQRADNEFHLYWVTKE